MLLESMHIYPLKSGKAWDVSEIDITVTGLKNDRRWMLVNENGLFLSQRNNALLSLIEIVMQDNSWFLKFDHQFFKINFFKPEQKDIKIWDHTGPAFYYNNPKIEERLYHYLGVKCFLVSLESETSRIKRKNFLPKDLPLSLVDGYPILVTSIESLKSLNEFAGEQFSMKSFRPNLVVSGGAAGFEDRLKRFQVGPVQFNYCKPCSRCVITNIDQDSGLKNSPGAFQFLRQMQKGNAMPTFGSYFFAENTGTIKITDSIKIRS